MSQPELDIVFACDCTGSMGAYIEQCKQKIRDISEEIMSVEKCNLQFALVAYRDHPPQEQTYITQVHQFTPSVSQMKRYVDTMSAAGGGDGPEAVSAALGDVLALPWRKTATKICIFIADAPPHGLGNSGDGFPNGIGPDPIATTHALAAQGVSFYCVAVEPNLGQYEQGRTFFKFLADTTGGRYITLGSAHLLPKLIVGGVIEQLSMDKLLSEVEEERQRMEAERGPGAAISEKEWKERVHAKMVARKVETYHVQADMQTEIPAEAVALYSGSASLGELRKKSPAPTSAPPSAARSSPARGGPRSMAAPAVSGSMAFAMPASAPVSYAAQKVESAKAEISMEQVERMVRKSAATKK
eukprot:TRINITY_DN2363_c0_g1_i1.p1 TRINITY_DN2363_c0_g1~~TRINITY_DN2363_c0_g1_i1.p1  ORF type:complete len:386 (-),score=92.79 TRINITY_DN2363_c0_g1_i1:29-1099(-)